MCQLVLPFGRSLSGLSQNQCVYASGQPVAACYGRAVRHKQGRKGGLLLIQGH